MVHATNKMRVPPIRETLTSYATSDASSPMDDIFSTPSPMPSMFAALATSTNSGDWHLEAPAAPIESPGLQRRMSKPRFIEIAQEYPLGTADAVVPIQGGSRIADGPFEDGPHGANSHLYHLESFPLGGRTPRQEIPTNPEAALKASPAPSSFPWPPPSSVAPLPTVSRIAGPVTEYNSSYSITHPPYPMPPTCGPNNHGMPSPCFVHSLLDHGASYSSWLEQSPHPGSPDSGKGSSVNGDSVHDGMQQQPLHEISLKDQHPLRPPDANAGGLGLATAIDMQDDEARARIRAAQSEFDSSDSDDGHSLTKQLAETAVSVRELSKQLGTTVNFIICSSGRLWRLPEQMDKSRPCTSSDEYPKRPYCYQGARQQANQAHSGISDLSNAKEIRRWQPWAYCVSIHMYECF